MSDSEYKPYYTIDFKKVTIYISPLLLLYFGYVSYEAGFKDIFHLIGYLFSIWLNYKYFKSDKNLLIKAWGFTAFLIAGALYFG